MNNTWLAPELAAEMVDVSASVAGEPDWVAAVEAAAEYVEADVRKDLWVDPLYVPGYRIKLGTAMLANRWYTRMRSPLGTSQNVEYGGSDFLREDPDIAKLLGVASQGKPVFGGAAVFDTVVEVTTP